MLAIQKNKEHNTIQTKLYLKSIGVVYIEKEKINKETDRKKQLKLRHEQVKAEREESMRIHRQEKLEKDRLKQERIEKYRQEIKEENRIALENKRIEYDSLKERLEEIKDDCEDFISRAQKAIEPNLEESLRDDYKRTWQKQKFQRENRELHRQMVRDYEKTEKGKFATSSRNYRRQARMKELIKDLSWEEKILIGRFYKNCPQGYEVDHIHPVSKGGKHCLSNLQYLTCEDNRSKSAKLDWKKNDNVS
jgi:hypothetical protein